MGNIVAIDQGTTSTTALIMNTLGEVLSTSKSLIKQFYPKPGFVEHDGEDIKRSVKEAVINAIEQANIKKSTIEGISITNQRETVCLFDKDGKSIRPFIVWQCRRSEDICNELKKRDLEDKINDITGLYLDPYFSATKLKWIFNEEPALYDKARSRQLLFGTVESYLCYWLSGAALHISDVTNASRTMLMDINTLEYNEECLDLFKIPKECLPKIVKNVGPYGTTKGLEFLPDGIPICGLIGDQQGALFGQRCFLSGDTKATFGTGCFILMNTGKELAKIKSGLLKSVGYQINDEVNYCLEGAAFIAGALIEFVKNAFGLINDESEIEPLAKSVKNCAGVSFVPSLCGLSAPYWRSDARGIITGLSRGVKKGHIARAVLEGIALQNYEIMSAMAKSKITPKTMMVDGGASLNNLLMQMQADLLKIPIIRNDSAEKTALGAAYLCALALGVFKSTDDIKKLALNKATFMPNKDERWTKEAIKNFKLAVTKA